MDILPTGHFAYKALHLRDISPTGQFAYYLDILPTRPNLLLFYFVYCVRSGESNQYMWRLICLRTITANGCLSVRPSISLVTFVSRA